MRQGKKHYRPTFLLHIEERNIPLTLKTRNYSALSAGVEKVGVAFKGHVLNNNLLNFYHTLDFNKINVNLRTKEWST
jgi:hypothetical protein